MSTMSPKACTAAELERRHGDILKQAPLAEFGSPSLLHKALSTRQPAIRVSLSAVVVECLHQQFTQAVCTFSFGHKVDALDM